MSIRLTGPTDRRQGIPRRITWKRQQGGQEAEDRRGLLEGKAKPSKVSSLEWVVRILSVGFGL